MSFPMRSKFTIAEIKDTTDEYQKMLDDSVEAGNTCSIEYLTAIVEDLKSCVKYASDWYNEGEAEDSDANEPRDTEEAGQDISSTSEEHS